MILKLAFALQVISPAFAGQLAHGIYLNEDNTPIGPLFQLIAPDHLIKSPIIAGHARYAHSWNIVPDDSVAIYIDDTKHYQLRGNQASTQWRSLLPSSSHLVHDGYGRPYTVALFHQLACLDILRKAFVEKNSTEETRKCFNYLQQAVLCHGDRRLESIRWIGKPNIVSVPGYWQCRDWEALYRAAEIGRIVDF